MLFIIYFHRYIKRSLFKNACRNLLEICCNKDLGQVYLQEVAELTGTCTVKNWLRRWHAGFRLEKEETAGHILCEFGGSERHWQMDGVKHLGRGTPRSYINGHTPIFTRDQLQRGRTVTKKDSYVFVFKICYYRYYLIWSNEILESRVCWLNEILSSIEVFNFEL